MPDITAPLFDSLTFSQPSIDIDSGEVSLVVTTHFTDDLSGIFDGEFADGSGGSPPQIRFVSSTSQFVDGIFDILNPVSGDRLDGVYEASVTLGPFAEAGTWQIAYLLLNDEAGNATTFTADNSSLIANAQFTVINSSSDTVAPILDDINLSQPSINIGNGDTTLTVTAHFTDALSGVFDGERADGSGGSSPQIRFISPSGQTVDGIFDILNPLSGDQHDGTFEATITLGPFAEAGTWQVAYLLLNDEAGNQTFLDPGNTPSLAGASFTITNANSDVVAPELQSITIGDPSLDPVAGNSTLSVAIHATDNASGIFDGEFADGSGGSPPQIRFVSSTSQFVDGIFDILNPVSGDRLDGVYEASVTLGPFAEAGTWQIAYLLLNDEAGNHVELTPDTSSLLQDGAFVLGTTTSDSLSGTADDDVIYGYGGDDILFAGDGDDFVYAGDDSDLVIAGSGLGNDTYDGGNGTDTVRYASTMAGVTVNLSTGSAIGTEIGADLLSRFEDVMGGDGNDTLTGNDLDNGLTGLGGNDTLDGGLGLDTLIGGLGNDTFVLANGTDTVSDSGGLDTITSTITRSLASYGAIENLTLQGTGAINGTGNGLNNTRRFDWRRATRRLFPAIAEADSDRCLSIWLGDVSSR